MRIDIITVLPEMLEGFFNCSIMSRAQKKGIAEIHIHNLRDYAYDRYRKVDDYPFGGFAGMVMKIEPIDRCISALKAEREYDEIIFTSPDGEQFNQPMANSLSLAKNLIILCGHFKGIDYRIREHFITKEISIGLKYQYNITDQIRIEPSMNYFFKNDGLSMFDINANIHYLFPIASNISLYPLAGFTYTNWHLDLGKAGDYDVSGSDGKFGVNLGAGMEFDLDKSWSLNFDIKYQLISDLDQAVFNLGVAYNF